MSTECLAPSRLDFEAVKRIIPQRFPFLMVDRIIQLEPGVVAVGTKNLSGNEWFYQGHFPQRAVTPGAMISEALAQTGIVFFHYSRPDSPGVPDPTITYLIGSISMRFLRPVWPGEQLRLEVRGIKVVAGAGILTGQVLVDGELVAKGQFTIAAKSLAEV